MSHAEPESEAEEELPDSKSLELQQEGPKVEQPQTVDAVLLAEMVVENNVVPNVMLVGLPTPPPPPGAPPSATSDRCAPVAKGGVAGVAAMRPVLASALARPPPRASLSCCVSTPQDESSPLSPALRGIPWRAPQPASSALACNECALSFKTRVQQARHRLTAHAQPPPQPCPRCAAHFSSRVRQRLHVAQAHRVLRLACRLCTAWFPSELLLNAHLLVQHAALVKAAPLICPLCSSVCVSAGQLTAHVRAFHTGERPLRCSVCPRDFDNVSSLLLHHCGHLTAMQRQHCAVCVAWFPAMELLQAHERCEHGDPLRFDCPVSKCEHHHHSAVHLSEHLAIAHPAATPYACRCGMAFNGLVAFREHAVQTLHLAALTEETPKHYLCRACRYSSTERMDLTEHEESHMKLLPLHRVAQILTLMQDAKVCSESS